MILNKVREEKVWHKWEIFIYYTVEKSLIPSFCLSKMEFLFMFYFQILIWQYCLFLQPQHKLKLLRSTWTVEFLSCISLPSFLFWRIMHSTQTHTKFRHIFELYMKAELWSTSWLMELLTELQRMCESLYVLATCNTASPNRRTTQKSSTVFQQKLHITTTGVTCQKYICVL